MLAGYLVSLRPLGSVPTAGLLSCSVKFTAYFAAVRIRADRAVIRDEWIERPFALPYKSMSRPWSDSTLGTDPRDGRYLRVVSTLYGLPRKRK